MLFLSCFLFSMVSSVGIISVKIVVLCHVSLLEDLIHEKEQKIAPKIEKSACASFFHRMLRKDKEEVEAIKHAKALEAEKAMYSVR